MATDEQSAIAWPHAYLSSTKHEYRTCFLCKVRKSMICIKCGSCLLCHPSAERIETRKPVFYIGIAMLFDIESPALAEIKRWISYLLCLNRIRVKVRFDQWYQKDMHVCSNQQHWILGSSQCLINKASSSKVQRSLFLTGDLGPRWSLLGQIYTRAGIQLNYDNY